MANNPRKTQHVCYVGNDSHVHALSFAFGVGWTHTNLGASLRLPPPRGNICGYSYSWDKSQHIILKSSDGQIHELYRVTEWRHADLTVATRSPIAFDSPVGHTHT